jgi:PAT family beta-lactamase induction signal transducer AmpG
MGALQAFSNLGYWAAALPGMGKYALFYITVPFLEKTVPVYPIYLASQGESITSGMGTAAFMAFLMSMCDKRFSAMHYAFFAMLFTFSARIFGYLGGLGAGSLGYAKFFFLSFLAAWPAFAVPGSSPWCARSSGGDEVDNGIWARGPGVADPSPLPQPPQPRATESF